MDKDFFYSARATSFTQLSPPYNTIVSSSATSNASSSESMESAKHKAEKIAKNVANGVALNNANIIKQTLDIVNNLFIPKLENNLNLVKFYNNNSLEQALYNFNTAINSIMEISYLLNNFEKENIIYKCNYLINSITNDTYITSTETISELIIRKIVEYNGKGANVYGVPGIGWYAFDKTLQASIDDKSINYFHGTNESVNVYMCGYNNDINKKIGVVFCTCGPGTAMAVTGISTLYNEGKAVVIILGTSSTNYQILDESIVDAISKKKIIIDSNTKNPQQLIDDAFYIAVNGTTENATEGPVTIFVNNTLWNSTYEYTNSTIPYVKIINKDITNNMIDKIFKYINSETKIIIRVGDRVTEDSIEKLALLTTKYKNIFVSITSLGKGKLNNLSIYTNVGIEGPISNNIVNDNYDLVDIVIEIGTGIQYSFVAFSDVKGLMPSESLIFYILDQKYRYLPSSATIGENIDFTDVNYFTKQLVTRFEYENPNNFTYEWEDTRSKQTENFVDLLNKYSLQTSSEILTCQAIISQLLLEIYLYQSYNISSINKFIITDSNIYITDIGLTSFITDAFLYHTKKNNILNFLEYSPIGSSIACAAGRIINDYYEDLVLFVGDGGFLNVPGYLIDLTNSLRINNKRCLFVLSNDNLYSNVATGEKNLFGETTTITSTALMQSNIKMISIIESLMGNLLKKSLQIKDLTEISIELKKFIFNWYNKINEFNEPGFYLIYYETTKGMTSKI